MANGVRLLLQPVSHAVPKGQIVSGVRLGLEIFGKGPGELAKGESKPAKLTLSAAFLKRARDEAKSKPSFEKFATLSGVIELKAGKPVLKLDAKGKIEHLKPEPASGRFRRINVTYDKASFEGAPVPVVPKAGEQPAPPHPLTILRLPEEPRGSRFLVIAAELEIAGKTSSGTDQNDLLDVPLPPIQLRVVKVDHHFAPSVEKLGIKYKIGGLLGSHVTLEVTSKHHAAGPIFKRELTAAELEDGHHVIEWDGKCNPASGDLKGRFLSPLFGPYDVKLSDGAKHEGSGKFNVLYQSLQLRRGDWTADGKEPPKAKKPDWVQFKLNELGYYGGPVGHDFDDYLKKAVIRYKANHKKMHEALHSSYTDAISADLETALAAGDNRRVFLEGKAFEDRKKTSKVFVEAVTYEEKAGGGSEFADAKSPLEKARLNRPLIPVSAEVFLLGKDRKKKAVDAPEAIGNVRVNWRFTDVEEDLKRQFTLSPGEPSRTRAYVERSLKLKGGRTGSNGDNCHRDFGGIREDPATNWETPFVAGTRYEPFDVAKDAGQKVCFTKAHNDVAKHKNRLGRAGVLFRPSNVAGDAYRLAAELDFTGLPNAAELEKAHGTKNPKRRIRVETGTFQIWRRARVAARVTWPARTNSNQWDQIREEFLRAYLDVDVASIDTQPIQTFLSAADYKTLVAANTSHAAADVTFHPGHVVGVALPAQGALSASDYEDALRLFVADNYISKINRALRRKLSENVRKKHPTGFVVLEFLAHAPLNVQTAPPVDTSVSAAYTNYITWAGSIGLPDSVIHADQKDPDHVYYVVAHEMGHNFWLKHWEHAPGSKASDHDTSDHNCAMSYSSSSCAHANHRPGRYTPHFCGQCNLKLRGWDIDDAQMPVSS